ncbi:efflux RND transporter periplasmic adaptor subunit [Selenomonas sputigena]|uniref:Efflux RND transporter periplasmic adaptor subunit n=1 Tax=Selenomonas sputigena TaxID=69823 RepID=A0ABV3X1S8_9FIRM
MDEHRYLKVMMGIVIAFVLLMVGYGVFINAAGRRHIEKMEDAQRLLLPAVRASYRQMHVALDDVGLTTRPAWTVDVNAQYEGVVETLFVKEGDHVKAGTVLATISNPALHAQLASAEASIEEARAMLAYDERVARRYELLLEQDATSRQEYENAAAKRDASKAQLANRVAQRDMVRVSLDKMVVRAPQDALVIHISRRSGDYIRPGESLLLLADTSILHGSVFMAHKNVRELLKHGEAFLLEIPLHSLLHKVYPISGSREESALKPNEFPVRIASIQPDPSVEADVHELLLEIDNEAGYIDPTYYNKVKIIARNTTEALAIPKKAVHKDSPDVGPYVYCMDADECLKVKEIRIGLVDDDFVEVEDGLAPGDLVITAAVGADALGRKVEVQEDGG